MHKDSGVFLRAVVLTVCQGQLMVLVTFSAVSVVLPALGQDLNASVLQLGMAVGMTTAVFSLVMGAGLGRRGPHAGRTGAR